MELALIACRVLHYATALTVFGMVLFGTGLAPPTLADRLARDLRRPTTVCAAIAAVTALLWLQLTAANLGGIWDDAVSPQSLAAVLFATDFGAVWQWHLAVSLLLFGWMCVDRAWPSAVGRWTTLTLATLVLVTLGPIGHAVMRSGAEGAMARASQVLHLLSAGYWLGSLVPVALCLVIAEPSLKADTMTALRRFSTIGHGAVGLVVASGLLNLWFIEGRLDLAPTITYRSLLDAKLAIVLAMTGLALVNRYWLVPRIGRDPTTLRRIAGNAIVVYGLGVVAICLAGAIGMLAPD